MRLIYKSEAAVEVRLSRRNLEGLLRELDSSPRGTATVLRHTNEGLVAVSVEEDAVHYA